MTRELFHIYGPFSIQSFGLAIAIGLLVFSYLFLHDARRKKIISVDNFLNVLFYGICIGVAGGRVLALFAGDPIEKITDVFAVWQGGLSLLGGVLALLICVPWYLHYLKVPLLPFIDLVALYAPLLQSISRLGCFMAGCCFGHQCDLPWAITYTDAHSFAPLLVALHPTQLYSALLLLGLFLFLYYVGQYYVRRKGQLFALYIGGLGIERFCVDFLRADREFSVLPYFSLHQWISLLLIVGALVGYLVLRTKRYKHS